MSMFTVCGQVIHVFDQPARVDRETGEKGEDSVRLQMLGEMPVQNGQSRMDMITVKIEDKKTFMDLKGKNIRLAVGAFSPAKGQIIYFVPKGSKPELVA